MTAIKHLTWDELTAGLDEIRRSPQDEGLLELIVRRPDVEQRESSELRGPNGSE